MCLLVPKQRSSSLNWDSSRPRGDGRDGRGCFPQPGNCKTKGRPSGSPPFPGSGRGRSPQPRGWIPAVPDTPGTSPRGHRPLLPTPAAIPAAGKHLPACLPACSRLAPASQLDFAPCTWKVRQCPRLELPAPHARPAQLPTPFSGVFKAAGGSCFLLLC